jgi:hypothetical protein
VIGYYVHHHGRGHLERARAIAAQLHDELTVLSSLERPAEWDGGTWIRLDTDRADHARASAPDAGGALHWAPLHHPGLRVRMAQIAEWVSGAEPAALVCDVSVEVACLARLMGAPVVSIALPGVRDDAPHLLGYRLSQAIVAPWPRALANSDWSSRWSGKTQAVGAFSRFDRRARPTPASKRSEPTVVLLLGAGGSEIVQQDLDDAVAATPGWSWRVFGFEHWIEDPWLELCDATVIVTHAGQNCIAEVAAARTPAIVIPQPRPFAEQLSTARVLRRERLAIVRESWPPPADWPALLEAAARLGGERWASWSDGHGAERAAAVIECVARRDAPQVG